MCLVHILALASLVAINSLSNGFALDDLIHIVENESIQTDRSLLSFFKQAVYPGDLYRPILYLSYYFNYQLFALEPLPFHLVNLILHCGVCVFIFLLLDKLFGRTLALASTVIFAVLPIHVEAIANVSGRAELLAALFLVTTLWFAVNLSNHSLIVRCTALFALSLTAFLSKESALCLVPLLLITPFKNKTQRIYAVSICLLAAIIYLTMRTYALGEYSFGLKQISFLDNPLAELDWTERAPLALALLGKYIALILIPYPLSADYSYAQINLGLTTPELGLALIVIVALVIALIAAFKTERKVVVFAISWFFLSFLVTSNLLFPIGTIFAERLAYLPSLGIVLLICELLYQSKLHLRSAAFIAVYCSIAILICFKQNQVWASNTTLHSYQINISPNSAKTQQNYAIVLRNQGQYAQARVHLMRALEIYPRFTEAAFSIASSYSMQGVRSGAQHWYHRALELSDIHIPSLLGLAQIYFERQQFDKALNNLNKALQIEPNNFDAKLGIIKIRVFSVKKDQLSDAERSELLEDLAELIKRRPHAKALRELKEHISLGLKVDE